MKASSLKKEEGTKNDARAKAGASIAPPSYGLSYIDQQPVQRQENKTGMSDNLKSGIESLSGIDVSDVRVHYNSSQPAQLQAHAYAQGNQIHLAPGQEKHLPHEAWHVVQQKQRRVKPNTEYNGSAINDSPSLEAEATKLGSAAVQRKISKVPVQLKKLTSGHTVFQLARYTTKDGKLTVNVDAGNGGCFATATEGAKEYNESSLQYSVNRYMDGNDPPNTKPTSLPMATQTYTMYAYPEKHGIGTLIAYHAMQYLGDQGMRYFQPDEAMSGKGKLMYAMIQGAKKSAAEMAQLISQRDGGKVDEDDGCCSSCGCFSFLFGSKKKTTEESALLPGISTYPAVEVNFPATNGVLKGKVDSKFDEA